MKRKSRKQDLVRKILLEIENYDLINWLIGEIEKTKRKKNLPDDRKSIKMSKIQMVK